MTSLEKKALALTAAFLLIGAGIRWARQKGVEIGPIRQPELEQVLEASANPPSKHTAKDGVQEGVKRLAADTPSVALPAADQGDTISAVAMRSLNHATLDELKQVKGVGEKTAQAILQLRASRSGFREWNELLEIKGIGPKRLEAIRELFSLDAAHP